MRALVILTILIASPAMSDNFSDYGLEQRNAQIQEKIDLMKSANELVEYSLRLETEACERLNALNQSNLEYQQPKLNVKK